MFLHNLINTKKMLRNQTTNYKFMPLTSWDIYIDNFHNLLSESKKKIELAQVTALAKKYNWQNNLEGVFSELEYEALIITDINQNIIYLLYNL